MRNKLRNYFLEKYIDHPDVFEKARAIMLYRFALVFFLIFLLPIAADIHQGLHKATIKHTIDLLLLCTLPFIIKHSKKLDNSINYFFSIVVVTALVATMMLNPEKLETISVVWIMFFIALSALIQRGIARTLYCLFLGWVPIIYILVNIKLNGALTWPWIVQSGTEQPPVFLMFIPMALCTYAMWSHTSTIQEAKETITRQKQIIEEKNTAITDSITYARRIQQAKLPKKEEIAAALPQSFVLFKPKDIVSGDFYFFRKKADTIFIAAADCTGHGVPGALMSMVGSEKLEEAVSQSSDPSEILKQLNNGIKTSLRQTHSAESTRDGMDIAFCVIGLSSRTIRFTGANRPLWIIRKNGTSVEEVKATKKAIGGLTDENQHFPTQEVLGQPGDTIYITTDGYADQFGGALGKKLMTKKFKDLLLGIQKKTMQEQEKYLKDFIEKWRSGAEQVDDILIIGIRV